MKKLVPFTFLALLITGLSCAQITERANDSTTYKMGTRPLKGTKALTVGLNINNPSFTSFKIDSAGKFGVSIMGRYFISDRTAIRGGIRFNKDSKTSRGLLIDTSVTNIGSQLTHDLKFSKREYAIMPGIERHFSHSNIFDVYVGGDALIGFSRAVTIRNSDFTSNVYVHEKSRTPETLLGLNGVIGLNFFVIDLPLSIGLEYNFSTIWSFGGKTHVQRETRDASGNVNTDDYYTEEKDAEDNPDPFAYSKLKRRSVTSNDGFRIMLNFYFK
jgi:hypothetical protein